jgi:hypothetical protein
LLSNIRPNTGRGEKSSASQGVKKDAQTLMASKLPMPMAAKAHQFFFLHSYPKARGMLHAKSPVLARRVTVITAALSGHDA